jgi:fructose-bisphosphate aldolase class 1
LKAWKGDANNLKAAQAVFIKTCEANGKAQLGQYEAGALSSESLFVSNYVY